MRELSKLLVGRRWHTAVLLRLVNAIADPTGDPARFALAQAAMTEMDVLADKSRYLHTLMFDSSFRNWKRKHLKKA